MKYFHAMVQVMAAGVASHAEARIEISSVSRIHSHKRVASHAEARIEILMFFTATVYDVVASHAEARIEIGSNLVDSDLSALPLMQRRELK